MKEVIISDEFDYITCEVNGLNLNVRLGDDRHYFNYPLRDKTSYRKFKEYLIDIYNSCEDKQDAFCCIVDSLQSDDIDEFVIFEDRLLLCDPRTEHEMNAYLQEAHDKVWLMRSCNIARKKPVDEAGRDAMERIFRKYDDIPKEGYNDWECGYWNGILGALRWVLGDERDFLDT